MLPDVTLFLKQAHVDGIYELLSMRLLLCALLKRQYKKGGNSVCSGVSGPTAGTFGSALPDTNWGSSEPSPRSRPLSRSPSSRAVPGSRGAMSAGCGIKKRRAVTLRIAGATLYLSSHAPGWASAAPERERSAMSAATAANSLTSEHGLIRLPLLPAGRRLPSWSSSPGAPAAPGHGPTLAWGYHSFPCLLARHHRWPGRRVTPVFWNRSLPKPLK